jgi:hypothetical protein
MQYIKDLQTKKKVRTVDSQSLKSFLADFWRLTPKHLEQG